MKKVVLVGVFLLIASTSHARDKWTGPTSPIDPMWGMSGSSIMAEALRDNPRRSTDDLSDPNYLWNSSSKDKQIKELEAEVEELKAKRGGW